MPLQVVTAGTITVAGGSDQVVGAGTSFAVSDVAGGLLCCNGFAVPIESVADDTHLTLALTWPGLGAGNQPYAIWRAPSGAASVLTAAQRLADVSKILQAATILQPDATGTHAQRAAYDGRPQGFVYVRTDVTPMTVCIKRTDANGAWSGYTPFGIGPQGPGGLAGKAGTNGVGGNYFEPSLYIPAQPSAGQIITDTLIVRATQFAAGLAGSRAEAKVAPTDAPAVFSLRKNGAQWATITFALGSKNGVFAGGAVSFAAGDNLSIVAPTPKNPALSKISITLAGTR